MHLPSIARGKRFALPRPTGSADALLLARHAQARRAAGQVLCIVAAEPADMQRLADELPFFAPELRVAQFPDWETLPYDSFSPHQDLISERLATLWRMRSGDLDVVLVSATTALTRLAPPTFMAGYTFHFKQKMRLNEAALKAQLTLASYSHVSQVVSPGEYAVRGGLIDLFPMGSPMPYRVDLFGDEVDSIRTFDPDTQRSLYPVPEVRLLPGREFPMDEAARNAFRSRWRERIEGDPSRSRIYKDIGAGLATAGIEYYLPLFFEHTATLFDYLGDDAALVLHGEVDDALQRYWVDTRERHRFLQHDPERPILPPEDLFLRAEDFYTLANTRATLVLRGKGEVDWARPLPDVSVERGATEPLAALERHLDSTPHRVLLLAESEGRRESLLELLRDHRIDVPSVATLAEFEASDEKVAITAAPLAEGFFWFEPEGTSSDGQAVAGRAIQFITETELFATTPQARRRRKQEQTSSVDALIKDLSELKIGDPVVHANHGIGRYQGLKHIDLGEGEGGASEFLHLEYADKALLYVPVAQLHLISRYTGVSSEEAPLHRLGSGQWDKAKRKAAEQVRDTAAELLNLYARRAAREGMSHPFSGARLRSLCRQLRLRGNRRPARCDPCGDPGHGQPEADGPAGLRRRRIRQDRGGVARRLRRGARRQAGRHTRADHLAGRAALPDAGRPLRQVAGEGGRAVALPLVQGSRGGHAGHRGRQHRHRRRHAQAAQSERASSSDLGLLIIDEEHRFGVRHKEAMKAHARRGRRAHAHRHADPAHAGHGAGRPARPERHRHRPAAPPGIKTFVRNEGHSVIREAVLRELKRGGQVYFLHNEVETIQNRARQLEELLPEARIAVAHGQLPERELERVMRDFIAQRYNLLLCSTIIETGIDVPSANTIVMSRADKFGLAQLHQLRGRVGRSHHQAYAYLLVPDLQGLSKAATLRLDAIQSMEELGSGFYLAMHDLEIRGAGEVLGDNQSGNMMEVGFQLYNDMLAEAVRSLRAGHEPDLLSPFGATTEINLHAPALLPDSYCGDVHTRLSLYKRLAMAERAEHIDALLEEITDRFGKLPAQGQTLFDTHRLRVLAKPYGVAKIDAGPKSMSLSFKPNPPIDAAAIIALVQKNRHIKLAGNEKLRIEREIAEPAQRAAFMRDLLRSLGQPTKALAPH